GSKTSYLPPQQQAPTTVKDAGLGFLPIIHFFPVCKFSSHSLRYIIRFFVRIMKLPPLRQNRAFNGLYCRFKISFIPILVDIIGSVTFCWLIHNPNLFCYGCRLFLDKFLSVFIGG